MDRQTGKTRKMRVIDSKKVITFPNELPNFETLRNLGTLALYLIATLPEEEILSYFYKKAYNANSKSV